MKKILTFLKKEIVLTAAWVLALCSMLIVPPQAAYLSYIDVKSLGILWSLMVIMAGLKGIGFFDRTGRYLLSRASTGHQLVLILVLLCFVSSMFITNDVALITFVPFAIFLLETCDREDLLIPVVTLQTLAANLGSMLTPIGNPQNLYLYGISEMSIGAFLALMFPYSLLTLLLLVISSFFIRDRRQKIHSAMEHTDTPLPRKKALIYGALFVLALLVVARILPYTILVAAVFLIVFLMEKQVLLDADYALLATFVGFFIFTGNLGNIPAVSASLSSLVNGHEVLTGVLASQVISNVPAALLLSGFTEDLRALIIGVNFGGLGTLIASMASLISFKALGNAKDGIKGRYLLYFTWMNLLYLAVLYGAYLLLR